MNIRNMRWHRTYKQRVICKKGKLQIWLPDAEEPTCHSIMLKEFRALRVQVYSDHCALIMSHNYGDIILARFTTSIKAMAALNLITKKLMVTTRWTTIMLKILGIGSVGLVLLSLIPSIPALNPHDQATKETVPSESTAINSQVQQPVYGIPIDAVHYLETRHARP